MLTLARALNYMHARSIILLNINISNLFLKDKNTVFFGDWSLARTVETHEKINNSFFTNSYEGLAKELLEEGRCSYGSDIFSLGCVF
jgi:serine/threonine protein kinase